MKSLEFVLKSTEINNLNQKDRKYVYLFIGYYNRMQKFLFQFLRKKSDDKFSGITTYNGLERCILNNQSYENESRTSRGEGCVTDSLDDDESSCSSSKDAFGSFSSKWLPRKRDDQGSDDWELSESPQHFYVKEKRSYAIRYSDVETMKEKFAKLLLGEDVTGGRMGVTTALALSNAITNLAGRLKPHSLIKIRAVY